MENQNVEASKMIFSFSDFMMDGGPFMWIILIVWTFGFSISMERVISYLKFDIDGEKFMNLIKKMVISNQVQEAIQNCSDSKSFLAFVLRSGLKRANQSREIVHDALEASILEVVPKIEKRLTYVSLASNLSTLLGLLGTIQGLIQSFTSVAQANPALKSQILADGISVAMNTTALGLVSSITLMVFHTFLTARGEKIVQEIEENSVKLIDLLGTRRVI
jgi:biopolymer transport protein ExbB/TolQ